MLYIRPNVWPIAIYKLGHTNYSANFDYLILAIMIEMPLYCIALTAIVTGLHGAPSRVVVWCTLMLSGILVTG